MSLCLCLKLKIGMKCITHNSQLNCKLQDEMTCEQFSSLPYPSKLDRCNKAFQFLMKCQMKVNAHPNVLREHRTMQEIFFNMLQLDSQLRQTVHHLFDKEIGVKHDMYTMKFSPSDLKLFLPMCVNFLIILVLFQKQTLI